MDEEKFDFFLKYPIIPPPYSSLDHPLVWLSFKSNILPYLRLCMLACSFLLILGSAVSLLSKINEAHFVQLIFSLSFAKGKFIGVLLSN